MAQKTFGKKYIKRLKKNQSTFKGDWFQLALLIACHSNHCKDTTSHQMVRYEYTGGDKVCDCPFCHNNNREIHEKEKPNEKNFFVHLEGANLKDVHLDYAVLIDAYLSDSQLDNVNLKHSELTRAHLDSASLYYANLEYADICHANFYRAQTTHAYFDNAELRDTKGLIFDECKVNRTFIEGNASDPWSILRRTYTGHWFFIHLILLIFFLLPYIGKVLLLTGISESISLVENKMIKVSDESDEKTDITLSTNRGNFIVSIKISPLIGKQIDPKDNTTLEKNAEVIPPSHKKFENWAQLVEAWNLIKKKSAFWLLIGFSNWHITTLVFSFFTCIMIVYNLLRIPLTINVNALREAEDRSKITPAQSEYLGGKKENQKNKQSARRKYKYDLVYASGVKKWWKCFWGSLVIVSKLLYDKEIFILFSPLRLVERIGLYQIHTICIPMVWICYCLFIFRVFYWCICTQVPMY
ncbi:MAG: pentapeptide repeat-containing protein [Streptococcaceae bacterium]|nr:pentapeptide repeat-containing protein [Streptococcaceae bacterium]